MCLLLVCSRLAVASMRINGICAIKNIERKPISENCKQISAAMIRSGDGRMCDETNRSHSFSATFDFCWSRTSPSMKQEIRLRTSEVAANTHQMSAYRFLSSIMCAIFNSIRDSNWNTNSSNFLLQRTKIRGAQPGQHNQVANSNGNHWNF